jgi:TRAP-type uncharacterized transport system substrate-binding protein
MKSWVSGFGLRVVAAVACVVAAVWLTLWYFIPAPPRSITMAAGVKGGGFEHFAELYREKLAAHHITLNLRYYVSGNENVRLINDPKSGVSAALMFAGQSNSEESPNLVSLGRIDDAPLWIFYRAAAPIERLTQMKGKRLNISPAVAKLIGEVLAAHGVNAGNAKISTLLIPDTVKALRNGDLDAIFMPPLALNAPIVQSLLRDPGAVLMNVTQAEALTRMFSTVHRLVLPQGVVDLENNIPASDVNLLASSDVVVVRKEVHPELIYLLAQTLKEVHGGAGVFQSAGEFPTQSDPEFPMAEEAVDYYKNGPSFLQRYLPFWTINYAKRMAAILVAAIAIVIPLFTYGPRLYAGLMNLRLQRLYRRLRSIEDGLQDDLTTPQVLALQGDLDGINRAARVLPRRQSELFFSLIMHIDLVRTRLASRLVALRGERAA